MTPLASPCPDCVLTISDHASTCPQRGDLAQLAELRNELDAIRAQLESLITQETPVLDYTQALRDDLSAFKSASTDMERWSVQSRIRDHLGNPNLPADLREQARLAVIGAPAVPVGRKTQKRSLTKSAQASRRLAQQLDEQVMHGTLSPSDSISLSKVAAAHRATAARFITR